MVRNYFEFGDAVTSFARGMYKRLHHRGKCANSRCPKLANTVALKMCGGCSDASYCDELCQRFAWTREDVGRSDGKIGHKWECYEIQERVVELKRKVGTPLFNRKFDRKAFFDKGIVDMFPRDGDFRMRSGFEGVFPREEVASFNIVRK